MNSPQAAGTDSQAQAIFSGRLDDSDVGAGGDPLRARQDTVGAVVLVGDAASRDAQVSAGVSRCAGSKAFHTPFFVRLISGLHVSSDKHNFRQSLAVAYSSSRLVV